MTHGQIIKALALMLLSAASSAVYPMISEALLQHEKAKELRFLILGEAHNYRCENVDRIMQLIKQINPLQAVNIAIECPEHIEPAFLKFQSTPAIDRFEHYEKKEDFASCLRLLRVDKRSALEGLAANCLNKMVKVMNCLEAREIGEADIAFNLERFISGVRRVEPITLNDYYMALEKSFQYLTSLKEYFHGKNQVFADIVEGAIRDYVQGREKVLQLFGQCSVETPLEVAVYELFRGCVTLEKLKMRFISARAILTGLSNPITDISFIEHMVRLFEVRKTTFIMVIGANHLPNLIEIARKLNFSVLSSDTIISEHGGGIVKLSTDKNDKERLRESLIHAVKHLMAHEGFCWSCLQKEEKLKLCTRCKSARYCGIDCQRADWPVHKKNCK